MERLDFEIGFVLRTAGEDCSNNGITKRAELLFVFPQKYDASEIEKYIETKNTECRPETEEKFKLTKEKCFKIESSTNGYTRAVAVFPRPSSEGTYMSSGNYITLSESTIRSVEVGHHYPIPVHDRFESWNSYETLSR